MNPPGLALREDWTAAAWLGGLYNPPSEGAVPTRAGLSHRSPTARGCSSCERANRCSVGHARGWVRLAGAASSCRCSRRLVSLQGPAAHAVEVAPLQQWQTAAATRGVHHRRPTEPEAKCLQLTDDQPNPNQVSTATTGSERKVPGTGATDLGGNL